jgi:hypothetical protein
MAKHSAATPGSSNCTIGHKVNNFDKLSSSYVLVAKSISTSRQSIEYCIVTCLARDNQYLTFGLNGLNFTVASMPSIPRKTNVHKGLPEFKLLRFAHSRQAHQQHNHKNRD